MGYIGAHGVMALHRYKYSGVDHSYVAKYVLQPFWTRFVTFFPLWMPPNMITLIGFMFLVTSALLGYIYSPQLDSPPPRWVHLAHGLLLFLYQTFDSRPHLVGKRLECCCDRLLMLLMVSKHVELIHLVLWESSLIMDVMHLHVRLKLLHLGVLLCVGELLSGSGSYLLSLSIVQLGNTVNGPTEGLMLIYLTHLFTAVVGAEWWAQSFGKSIPIFSWVPFVNEIPTNIAVLILMIVFAVIPTVSFNVQNVHKVVEARKGSMVMALAMLYPFVVLLGGILAWDYLSPIDLIGRYPPLVVVGTGLAFGFLVGRMILAHLCDEPKGLKTSMCMALLYLPFALANALTARLNDGRPVVDELWVVLGFVTYTATLYLYFATSVIHEITTALGIYCFRITRKEA